MDNLLPMLPLLLHAAATWAMFGLIWFVQVVHYPLFAAVGGDFPSYEADHRTRTGWLVAPLMLAELMTALVLLHPRLGINEWLRWIGFVLVVVIWISTGLLQVPMHNALSREFQSSAHRRLVLTNWIRTSACSVRAVIAAAMIWQLVA